MGGILYDARKIMAYERLMRLGEYAGKSGAFMEALWTELVLDGELMAELMYYLDHHTLLDRVKCRGYALTDLYVWQMDRYNLIREIGKNTSGCNKEAMVLNAFRTMVDMKKDPDTYIGRLTRGTGMDEL